MSHSDQRAELDWQVLCRRGLLFFGRVTASMTHEIKNGLAVMNEQSHLLKELLEMAAQGREPDLARLEHLAGRLIQRVKDTDAIIKCFNTFAHTVDEDSKTLDAGELLQLTMALYERLASLKGVSLEYPPPSAALSLRASPFFLHAALFDCLEAVAAATPGGGVLSASVAERAPGVEFRFQGAEPGGKAPEGGPAPEVLAALGAGLEWGAEQGSLTLRVPASPPSG